MSTFIVGAAERRGPGRTSVITPAACPACSKPLRVGGWGYPDVRSGDLRLHHYRCVSSYSRREIADARLRQKLPRDVAKAKRAGVCAQCDKPIKVGNLIERDAVVGPPAPWRHVKCPDLCVRCETPILPDQDFREMMPKPGQDEQRFGYKHAPRCRIEDLRAKEARDAERNADRQRKAAARATAPIGPIGPVVASQVRD
jgi:hypothetical protein